MGRNKWLRLLEFICPEHLYEEIEGDLIQKFNRDVDKWGEKKARRRLAWHTVSFFRPGIILRNKFSLHIPSFHMLKHFFKIFFRTSLKNSGYSFINVSGLAVGLACSIFIILWVMDEVSYDDFHQNKDQVYKIMAHHTFPDGTQTYDNTPGPLAPALKGLPEVAESGRIIFRNQVLLQNENKSIYHKAVYADSSIFKIFTIPLLSGTTNQSSQDNNSIVISRKVAALYFKDENPIGKVFRVDNTFDAKVAAVFEDLPENSTLEFDFIIPYRIYAKTDQYNNEWGAWSGGVTYVKLHEKAKVEALNKKIHEAFTKPNIWVRWDPNVELFLHPMSDWRLHNNFTNGEQHGGRITYVTTFSIVAIFILLIACINFMNLATARSVSRAREIGVRKVVGAGHNSLVKQFMMESVLTAFISLFFALLAVHLLMPFFNELTGKQTRIDYTNPLVYVGLLGITVLAGLMAGSYPAVLLSSFKPVNVLKGTIAGLSGAGLRKGLVVFQFSLSVVLIICAIGVYQQIDYMRTKNLGFNKDDVFYFRSNADLRKNFDAFRNQVLQNPAIKVVGQSNDNPTDLLTSIVLADNAWPGKTKEDNIAFKSLQCDYDMLPALGFTFVDGRNFSREFVADSNNYIINEEAARSMRLENPIGEELVAPRKGKIIGLIKDFHSTDLKGRIAPVIIALRPEATNQIFIRYEAGRLEEAMEYVKDVYKKLEPNFPLEYAFMDQTFDRQYQDEILMSKLSTCFTVIAIFISFLGLFGLASFTTEKRAKEIGVRKVMGASVTELLSLVCNDFVKLIVLSLILGLPVAWWAVQKFLQEYEYHTEPGVSVFLITAFLLLFITIVTVSCQSSRAALANPVKTLRTE
ncbi:ABC transporter permease [Chryseolinea sp. H1M3-3]|uniref:ABC transporter permease n=1 Tax=Chryseolinea sp. H1M3-3 TaxID=3034144 RepID=UPI0023EBED8E|nr:ABC transporter permease [Chryseolinea sp. H1M3-3]